MDLTRRGLLGRAAAASGALLLAPRVVYAADSGEAVFDGRIPGSHRLETKRTFELVGIETPADAQLRARGVDGRWSDWLDLHRGHEGSALSDPVWVGRSDAIEVRARHSLRGGRLVFVHSGHPAKA